MPARGQAGTLLVVLLLSACGSGGGRLSKADYEQRVQKILPQAASKILKTRLAIERARSPGAERRSLDELQRDARAVADDLDRLEPPREIAAPHANLVAALRRVSAAAGGIRRKIKGRDTSAAQTAGQRLEAGPEFEKIATALEAIIAKGYELGLPSK